jgi:MFS family permease
MSGDSRLAADAAAPGDRPPPRWRARPVYRWYMLAILLLIYIFGAVDRSVVSVIAEPLKHEFHLSDSQIGALGGMAYSLTFGLFVLPMGWLIDRVSRRRLLSISVVIWSLLTACGAVAGSFVQLFVARMGVGASEATASPASFSLITDIFPVRQRNTAVSIYYAGAPGGQLVIFLLGGWLLMHFDWRAVFLVASIPGLILAALLFFTCEEPVRGAQDLPAAEPGELSGNKAAPSVGEIVRLLFLSTPLRNALLANMICTGVGSTLIIWLTSFLVRIHGLPVSQAAIWVGLGYGLPMTIASVIVGPLADRYSQGRPARLARIPWIASVAGLAAGLAMGLAPTLPMALVLLVVFSLMSGLYTGPSYSLVLSLAQANIRGSTMAAAKLLVILIGSGLFPVVTGAISDAVGGPNSIRPAILATVALLAPAAFFFYRAGLASSRAAEAEGPAMIGGKKS